MAFSMKLWQVNGKQLAEVAPTGLDDEQRLEDWVAKDPSVLGIDLLLIGRQVMTASGGRIDLLGMDAEANLVILELKRRKTPREVVAQALDYASWVKDLSYDEINSIAEDYLGKNLKAAFEERFGCALPEQVNVSHTMVVLASELDDSSERIVEYLAEQHHVPINVIFFTFFKSKSGEFLGRAWLMDPEETQQRSQSKKQAPWSGYYFVNVGETEHDSRNWDDCRKYGFLSAGYGPVYSDPIKRLKEGDMVFAYMKGLGYVGYGTVAKEAVMLRDFVVEKFGQKLVNLPLKSKRMLSAPTNPLRTEWLVAIKWAKTFPRNEAKTFKGAFANQNIVCKLRHPETVNFLKREFGLP